MKNVFQPECCRRMYFVFTWAKNILNLHIKTKHDTAGVGVTVFSMPGLFTVKKKAQKPEVLKR